MRIFCYLFTATLLLLSCKTQEKASQTVATTKAKSSDFREFRVLDSEYINRTSVFKDYQQQIADFKNMDQYNDLILEKSIPELQQAVYDGELSYKTLTLFYLNRIYNYDRNNKKSLNTVISLNPDALKQAIDYDLRIQENKRENIPFSPYTIMGMPVLLKDNINTAGMPTTAGAAALQYNQTNDARLVSHLKENGAVILGKANLSEWAYYFCGDCPSGYSAIGGQTLNPYGRRTMDTGGSSSGSGASIAANFAVAAVGSETAGSILSPSSQHSLVGYKPTVGSISGTGVVPISSYLDTAGPMTKSVVDNAILMQAMQTMDVVNQEMIKDLQNASVKGKRFGVFPAFKSNPLYVSAIEKMQELGATIIELEERDLSLDGFIKLLNADMKRDLPSYFIGQAAPKYSDWDVQKVMDWNKTNDSLKTMPYGQRLFQGIIDETPVNDSEFYAFKTDLTTRAQDYYFFYTQTHNLDGFLSINNYSAAGAAIAMFPAMTVPMGYDEKGQPYGLTFIAPNEEDTLLYYWAAAYENATKHRKIPSNYKN